MGPNQHESTPIFDTVFFVVSVSIINIPSDYSCSRCPMFGKKHTFRPFNRLLFSSIN